MDYVGTRQGILTVLSWTRDNRSNKVYICKCDCGNVTRTLESSIKNGVESCGCLRNKRTGDRSRTHGMSNTPVYYSYRSMIRRCYNEENDNYDRYGRRGIKVCDRWLESFENFYEDMGDRPKDCTLDRINPDGNYEPSNCRWADGTEQSINKSKKKDNNTGIPNIRKDDNGYLVGVARKGLRRRVSCLKTLNIAIEIRDLWIREYKENKEKWLEDTKSKEYQKTTKDKFKL